MTNKEELEGLCLLEGAEHPENMAKVAGHHAVAFALWLKDLDLMIFAKYHDEADGGEAAIKELYQDFLDSSEEDDPQATDFDYGIGDLN